MHLLISSKCIVKGTVNGRNNKIEMKKIGQLQVER